MKILFLIPHVFIPSNAGNKQLIVNLLKYIVRHAECELCVLIDQRDNKNIESEKINALLPGIKKVYFFNKPVGFVKILFRLKALLFGYPPAIGNYWNDELASWLIGLKAKQFDIVHFDMFYMAQYHKFCQDIPALLVPSDAYSLSALLVKQAINSQTEKLRMTIAYLMMHHHEKRQYGQFDMICPVAEKDSKYLNEFIKGPEFKTIGVAIDDEVIDLPSQRLKKGNSGVCNILYIGPISQAGVAAGLGSFIAKSFPRICELFPNTKLFVVGSAPVSWIKEIIDADKRIVHIDFVEDYFGFFNNDWIYVHPQRTNAGFQTKVQQAMAIALPVVGYDLAFTGMDVENNIHCFVCDSMDEFTASILSLMRSPILREKIGVMAREKMLNQYSIESIGSEYIKCYKLLEQIKKY